MGFCWRASDDCESCFNALIPGPQLPLGLFTIADKGWRQSRHSKAWSDISRWAEQEEEEEEENILLFCLSLTSSVPPSVLGSDIIGAEVFPII